MPILGQEMRGAKTLSLNSNVFSRKRGAMRRG
jgi:hypothetical protein